MWKAISSFHIYCLICSNNSILLSYPRRYIFPVDIYWQSDRWFIASLLVSIAIGLLTVRKAKKVGIVLVYSHLREIVLICKFLFLLRREQWTWKWLLKSKGGCNLKSYRFISIEFTQYVNSFLSPKPHEHYSIGSYLFVSLTNQTSNQLVFKIHGEASTDITIYQHGSRGKNMFRLFQYAQFARYRWPVEKALSAFTA